MLHQEVARFPFDFIPLWIRPHEELGLCLFCQEAAEYDLYQYMDLRDMLIAGVDTAWMKAIRQQVNGMYEVASLQPVCLACCIDFAAVVLGKRRILQYHLTVGMMSQKQKGIALSQVVVCTVKAFNDEGHTWIASGPNTSIEDVVCHLKAVERTERQ